MTTETKSQQIEFDVFPKDAKSNYSYLSGIKGDTNAPNPSVHVVFSQQSVIIIFICVLMCVVASFSLGVEKGKLVGRSIALAQKTQIPEALPSPAALIPAEQKTLAAPATPVTTAVPVTQEIKQTSAMPSLPVTTAKENTPTPLSGYVIQIATVKTEMSAKSLVEKLIKRGVPSFTRSSGKYIVVLAGNFEKKEEAQVSLKELKKTYSDCFIKKI